MLSTQSVIAGGISATTLRVRRRFRSGIRCQIATANETAFTVNRTAADPLQRMIGSKATAFAKAAP